MICALCGGSKIFVFSSCEPAVRHTVPLFLLLIGMVVSQVFDFVSSHNLLIRATTICLSYIMIEVGLEFMINKSNLRSYVWDYIVAATAAAFPWILCSIYFVIFLNLGWREALLIGRFAAPTSAGVLFAMLAAAGLGTTWLFRKARILAVFDDLDTILLMIPLQFMFIGMKQELLFAVLLIFSMLAAGYRWLHFLRLPIGKVWLLAYGALIVFASEILEHTTHVHLEVLLPAFVLGAILYNPHDPAHPEQYPHEHRYLEPIKGWPIILDRTLKGAFMFFVGCSLPKIDIGNLALGVIVAHVLALTVLSNIGKCFPSFCYRKEAPLKHRIALSVAMFPRGEVGAGVLLIAMAYNLDVVSSTLPVLSLALNLLLTGVFIGVVIKLINSQKESCPEDA